MKNILYILSFIISSVVMIQAQDTIDVRPGWNIIGAASTHDTSGIRSEPTGLLISPFYGFVSETGYQQEDTLKRGKGFWVKANQNGIIIFKTDTMSKVLSSFLHPQDDTIDVRNGWNLVGALTTKFISQIRTEPNEIINSSWYEFLSNGYSTTDTLRKGKGYWIKVNQDGLLLSATENLPPHTPYNPIPADSAIGVSTSLMLSWSCRDPNNDLLTYDIYFGTDNPPVTKISAGQSDTSINRSGLNNNTSYYWKIVAWDNHGDSTSGEVWRFITSPPPNQPPAQSTNPSPADSAFNVSTSLWLSWSCSDPENDPLTYDVYFDTVNPPSNKVSGEQSDTSFNLNGLSDSTRYFWKIVAKDIHGDSSVGPIWTFITVPPYCPATVSYEGKIYNTVLIGTQCWFKENLDAGIMVISTEGVDQYDNGTLEKFCYNDNPSNCSLYGGLYQWGEAMQYVTTAGAQGICPAGWHIPTYAEWQTLKTTVNNDGNALKAIGQGTGDGTGTNTSGFSALLSGYRNRGVGSFAGLGIWTFFWISLEYDGGSSYEVELRDINSSINLSYFYKLNGLSVRCVKD